MNKKLILAIVLGGLVVLGVSAYLIFRWQSNRGLGIEITLPEKVLVGVPFEAKIKVSNSSLTVFNDARLELKLPVDVVFVGSKIDKNLESRNLGNLGRGSLTEQTYNLMAIRGENTLKDLEASVAYQLGSRFVKKETARLVVDRTGFEITLEMPQKIFSGGDFDVLVKYRNLSDIDFKDLELVVDYPSAFTYRTASLIPDLGNNRWLLGDLRRGSEGSITISGNVVGPDESFYDFNSKLQASFLGASYVISEKKGSFSISSSPLSLNITLNNSASYIAKAGDTLEYRLTYKNNTDTAFRDVVMNAQLVGAMFDLTTLTSRGFLRASDNTIIWNAASVPELALIQPNSSGAVDFRVRAKTNYPITRLSDKNFLLKVNGRIESPTVPIFISASKTVGMTRLENKVAGAIEIDAKGYRRDTSVSKTNTGPFPPKVGQPSQYLVHWQIKTLGVDAENVEVRAFLGGGVRYLETLKSDSQTQLEYNSNTQELVWRIPKIISGRGVVDKPFEVVFQIEATPSQTQVGNFQLLVQKTSLKAKDSFTSLDMAASDEILNTQLSDDSSVAPSQGLVIQ